jgi:hypothetical protein
MDATEPRGERPRIHAYRPEPAMQRSVRDRQTREKLEQELDIRQQQRHLATLTGDNVAIESDDKKLGELSSGDFFGELGVLKLLQA